MSRVDGRAIFAAVCAVGAVPASWNPFFPLIFGPIGVLAALASVTDAPASRETRVLALVAALVCLVLFAAGLHGVLVHPQLGGT